MTQGQLAAEIGTSTAYVSLIERGNRNPSFSTIEGIARAFGMTLSELCSIESEASERRKHPRVAVNVFLERREGEAFRLDRTRDLSLSGAFVDGWSNQVGTELLISLVGGPNLWVRAQVTRQTDNGVAIAFLDPSRQFLSAVQEILARAA
jgi:transcriptional regulator with XRE-family HTH domain